MQAAVHAEPATADRHEVTFASVWAVFLGAVVLVAAGSDTSATDLYPRLRPKPRRDVPIMVPIGCLMSAKCRDSAFEGAAKGSVVTAADIARGGSSVSDKTSSDAKVYGVNEAETRAAALKFLIDVRDEMRKLTPAQLVARNPQPASRGIIGPAPERVNRALARYINGKDYFNCNSSFEAMRRAAQKIPAGKRRSEIVWALYPHFIESCYRGKLDSLGDARERIVVLLRKTPGQGDYSLYCLGFNVARNYVLTARHCAVEPGEVSLMLDRYTASDPDAFIEIEAPLAGTRALVLGEPDKLYTVRVPKAVDQDLKFFPFEPDKDTFILELDAPERAEASAFPVAGSVAQWDAISIPAIFVDDAVLSEAIKSGDGDRVTKVIDGASAIDDGPMCSLVYSRLSERPYVFHGCQTRYGYSGGPILRRGPRGAMTLVGVHTGTVDAQKPIDNWPYVSLFPNYGLRLPPQVIALGKR